jgi:A/G-specific adenine glycosylase
MDAQLPDGTWKQKFRRRLLAWFRRHARELPWRRTFDPYAIWISEIMLQQTQVATVIDYYHRFLEKFPNIQTLAAADEQEVLRCWEGLGYYRRARQLHRAAREIVDLHDGRFPREIESIRALPGIGRYTAGAIASIAYGACEPILEANTIRVFSRLLAYKEDPTTTRGQRRLWEFSEAILPRKHVGAFNQALMELGSELCTPRDPVCDDCPVRTLCPTLQAGLQDQIPAVRKKTTYEDVVEAALIVRRRDRVLLRCCGPDERWAGLWDFPRFPVAKRRGRAFSGEVARRAAELTGQQIELGRRLTVLKHGVTRFRITLLCHEAHWIRGVVSGDDLRWVHPQQLVEFPLSVTGRKISQLLI